MCLTAQPSQVVGSAPTYINVLNISCLTRIRNPLSLGLQPSYVTSSLLGVLILRFAWKYIGASTPSRHKLYKLDDCNIIKKNKYLYSKLSTELARNREVLLKHKHNMRKIKILKKMKFLFWLISSIYFLMIMASSDQEVELPKLFCTTMM